MNQYSDSQRGSPFLRRLLIVVGCIVVAIIALTLFVVFKGPWDENSEVSESLPKDAVEDFYVGVSSLDVEANQRAREIFESLSEKIPNESAVWANYGIALLRLNEIDAAKEALHTAREIAPNDDRIIWLHVMIEERAGQYDAAIDLIRALNTPDIKALYLLADLVERTGRSSADEERLVLLKRILTQAPDNLLVQLNRARIAAKLQNKEELQAALQNLDELQASWNETALSKYESSTNAANSDDFRKVGREILMLENVLKPTPIYQQSLAAVQETNHTLGQPIRVFMNLAHPSVVVAEADRKLHFALQSSDAEVSRLQMLWALALSGERYSKVVWNGNQLHIDSKTPLPVPSSMNQSQIDISSLLGVDLNSDFRLDLVAVGENGLVIYVQNPKGEFSSVIPQEELKDFFQQSWAGVWAIDIEADGDLDLLLSPRPSKEGQSETPATCQILRNNGDMTFSKISSLESMPPLRNLHWVDFDNDGDGDVVGLDTEGRLLIAWNERSGRYTSPEFIASPATILSTETADTDGDGIVELITLDDSGDVRGWSYDDTNKKWTTITLVHWNEIGELRNSSDWERINLRLADIDNNGAVDLIASAGMKTAIWLSEGTESFIQLTDTPDMFVNQVVDANDDGRLDLIGISKNGVATAINQGEKAYGWISIKPQANPNPGDQRINSFGIGGQIEIFAGQLRRTAPIQSPIVHFGIGENPKTGVARIMWPNGTSQAEFDLNSGASIIAAQRLKGSCPWVFARNAKGVHFVKDFIWRSPLGLKINSQETAGVSQTEDWIKIPGELLSSLDGTYEIRITADLWETHFFDHVSLMTVDHPPSMEVYVDERFVPTSVPDLRLHCVTPPTPFELVKDEQGDDVTDQLTQVDQVYVDSFPLGRFQGVAEDHWIEFEIPADVSPDRSLCLIGSGWIYPTDSSLNVAISQGSFPKPQGLVLEAYEPERTQETVAVPGHWKVVNDKLGFLAGKNKTVVLPLPNPSGQSGTRRYRLRTNLEIYWDFLGWSVREDDTAIATNVLDCTTSDLRYRGFSKLSAEDRRKPDLPIYDTIAATGPRWRDLQGYYTRFGEVGELLSETDDRYVIMNAGDEMVLKFPAQDEPPSGWTRDFVLVGDGWVKDGDFNTTHSKTVCPLPSHANAKYDREDSSLESDPVYLEHPTDWERFHTRYRTDAKVGH